MKNLTNVEIKTVSGGGVNIFCDVRDKSDKIYATLGFVVGVGLSQQEEIYGLLKSDLISSDGTSVSSRKLDDEYTFRCHHIEVK